MVVSETISACLLPEYHSACLLPSKSKSMAICGPKDSVLIIQELVAGKSLDKEYNSVLASRLPTGDIIPSSGGGRKEGGEQGKEDGFIVARYPECHLQLVCCSCQGSLPLSFMSVQKLYT